VTLNGQLVGKTSAAVRPGDALAIVIARAATSSASRRSAPGAARPRKHRRCTSGLSRRNALGFEDAALPLRRRPF